MQVRKTVNWWDVKRGATTWRSTGQGSGGTGDSGDGGDGGGDASGGNGGEGGGTGSGTGGEKQLSQAEVNRIATREKQEGTKAGRAALLKELGIEDVKEAARLIEQAKKSETDSLSETERLKREAAAANAKAEADKVEVAREKLAAKVERRLLASGLQLDKKDEAKAERQLARASRLLDLDLDADQDAIRDAVKELKAEMPNLFAETDDEEEEGEQEQNRRTGNRTGDPGRPPRQKKPSGTSKERARATLLARHPSLSDKK